MEAWKYITSAARFSTTAQSFQLMRVRVFFASTIVSEGLNGWTVCPKQSRKSGRKGTARQISVSKMALSWRVFPIYSGIPNALMHLYVDVTVL